MIAPVYVVTHKNVGGLWDFAALVKKLQQVVELAVDIAADRDRSSHRVAAAFLDEYLFDPFTQLAQLALAKDFAFLQGFKPLFHLSHN